MLTICGFYYTGENIQRTFHCNLKHDLSVVSILDIRTNFSLHETILYPELKLDSHQRTRDIHFLRLELFYRIIDREAGYEFESNCCTPNQGGVMWSLMVFSLPYWGMALLGCMVRPQTLSCDTPTTSVVLLGTVGLEGLDTSYV